MKANPLELDSFYDPERGPSWPRSPMNLLGDLTLGNWFVPAASLLLPIAERPRGLISPSSFRGVTSRFPRCRGRRDLTVSGCYLRWGHCGTTLSLKDLCSGILDIEVPAPETRRCFIVLHTNQNRIPPCGCESPSLTRPPAVGRAKLWTWCSAVGRAASGSARAQTRSGVVG